MKRALVVAVLAIAAPARADDTVEYVVQEGDTCLGIAIRVIGDRAAYEDIHRLNPNLGPTPHELVAGTVLILPKTGGPDARLTRARGDVKVRKPDVEIWDAAQRGMDLFRAWRVGSADDV